MTEIIQRKLNDSAFVRWTALILIALTMFFGYMFVDMMSPLQSMIEAQRGWTPDVFGMYGSSEFIFNVFGFLILAGIILNKMGIRFTGVLSASLMFIGASIKYYGVSDAFIGSGIETWLNSWWVSFPGSAKLASLGFMIFGCGMEMAGITVSKTIAKWFEGKEMALAMGLEMAIARVGVFAVFTISPWLANMAPATVVRPVAFCTLLLLIGLLTYVVFTFMDRKLDKITEPVKVDEVVWVNATVSCPYKVKQVWLAYFVDGDESNVVTTTPFNYDATTVTFRERIPGQKAGAKVSFQVLTRSDYVFMWTQTYTYKVEGGEDEEKPNPDLPDEN